jgi:hypothetical protein
MSVLDRFVYLCSVRSGFLRLVQVFGSEFSATCLLFIIYVFVNVFPDTTILATVSAGLGISVKFSPR